VKCFSYEIAIVSGPCTHLQETRMSFVASHRLLHVTMLNTQRCHGMRAFFQSMTLEQKIT
jgi:hypothetical protein